MYCRSIALLAFFIASAILPRAFAESDAAPNDHLINRLRDLHHVHVGLRTDDRLSGYVLYTYTASQHKENLTFLSAHVQELEAFADRVDAAEEKLRAAEQLQEHRGATAKLTNTLKWEASNLKRERPNSKFTQSIALFTVVHYGSDYLELRGEDSPDYLQIRKAEAPEGTVLIPVSKICKIVISMVTTGNAKHEGEPRSR